MLLLVFFVIWRLVRVAELAQDQFGRLLTVGIVALLFFQTFINVGMNMSIVPVTGMTLPFISYGGSSLLSMMAAIGLAPKRPMLHSTKRRGRPADRRAGGFCFPCLA